MRIVILTNEQGNQIALCNKFAEYFDVCAIVFSKNIPKKRPSYSKRAKVALTGLCARTVGRELVKTWFDLQDHYSSIYENLPSAEIVRVDNVNHPDSINAIERHRPDLVIVSGTNLVGKKIIKSAKKQLGIVNLHTGISPYVKGGPNCTNWCLAKGWFHLIGNTVMWLDLGIDTGNLIATGQTPLDGTENLFELHLKVMEHAHEMYVKSVLKISRNEKVRSIPQNEITEGHLFYSTDWGYSAIRSALKNFENGYRGYFTEKARHKILTSGLKLFPVDDD